MKVKIKCKRLMEYVQVVEIGEEEYSLLMEVDGDSAYLKGRTRIPYLQIEDSIDWGNFDKIPSEISDIEIEQL